MPRREDLVRDYLHKHIADLPQLVRNLDAVRQGMQDQRTAFFEIPLDDGGPNARDLLQRIVLKRSLLGLEDLHDLRSLGTEFTLLDTGLRGKQPSADLLVLNEQTGAFIVPEVKQDRVAERQAVTELNAYSQGLQNRFWGLCPADHIWMPISTEWRMTVRAAFVNQIIWGNRAILPFLCNATFHWVRRRKARRREVQSLTLDLLNLVPELSETLAASQFAWDVFDSFNIAMKKPLSDARTFVDFIVATASRLGLSGFVLYHVDSRAFPFPCQILIGATNPFRAALKRRQLEIVLDDDRIEEEERLIAMRREIRDGLWIGQDMDLITGVDVETGALEAMAEIAEDAGRLREARRLRRQLDCYESVVELASAASNRLGSLFHEVKSRLDLFAPQRELGTPSIPGLLKGSDFRRYNTIEHVGYFGLMGEAVYDRLEYEFRHALQNGQGRIFGELGGDPLRRASMPDTFLQFMALMNYEHNCQAKYRDDPNDEEDGEGPLEGVLE